MGSIRLFYCGEISSWTIRKQSHPQTRHWNVLIVFGEWYIQRRWLISSWCFLWYLFRRCRLAIGETFLVNCEFEGLLVGEWAGMPPSGHVVFPTSSKREVSLSSPKRSLLNQREFLFSADKFCLFGMRSSYFLSKASGNCYTFRFILFYFYFFKPRQVILILQSRGQIDLNEIRIFNYMNTLDFKTLQVNTKFLPV